MKSSTSSKTNDPFKVAITGGIGSGKSVVCKIFELLGVPVFYADSVARFLMDNASSVKQQLIDWYGQDIYLPEGTLHRKKLAQIIFNDKIELEKVNRLVHPIVRQEFVSWCKAQTNIFVVQESAILIESGQEKTFDHVILVVAPTEDRIRRVMHRDNQTREKVLERMKNQWSDHDKMAKANDIVWCDDRHMIIPQIIELKDKLILKWQNLENG